MIDRVKFVFVITLLVMAITYCSRSVGENYGEASENKYGASQETENNQDSGDFLNSGRDGATKGAIHDSSNRIGDTSIIDTSIIDTSIPDSQLDEGIGTDASGEPDSSCTWQQVFPLITSHNLNAVWGSAPDDVYVVGEASTMLHYNSSSWKKVNIGAPCEIPDLLANSTTLQTCDFIDVWGSGKDDVYVVARSQVDSYVFHYDGKAWRKVNLDLSACDIDTVLVTDPNNVFVAGRCNHIYHFDGSNWNSVRSLDPNWDPSRLVLFSCSDQEVYAVDRYEPSISYRYDRSTAHFEPIHQWDWDDIGLYETVICASEDDLWAIQDNVSGSETSNRVTHWNGQSWLAFDIEAPETAGQQFTNMFIIPNNDRFFVGDNGALFYYDNSTWKQASTGVDSKLNDIWSADGSLLFAVGNLGVVLEGSIHQLVHHNKGVDSEFVAFLNLGSDGLAAMSEDGDLVIGNESEWRVMNNDLSTEFMAKTALGTHADDILIGGGLSISARPILHYEPTLVHFDGAEYDFVEMDLDLTAEIQPCNWIAGIEPIDDTLYMICDNGDVIWSDGTTWRSVAPNSSCSKIEGENIIWNIASVGILGNDPDDFFIWGLGISIPLAPALSVFSSFGCHYNGTSWTELPLASSSIGSSPLTGEADLVWGSKEEAFVLVIDYRSQTRDICAISIKRISGTDETLAVGCDPTAENVIDQSQDEFTYPGPDNPSFIIGKTMAIYYDGTKFKQIPYDSSWFAYPTQFGKPYALIAGTSDTNVYAAVQGSIYQRHCPQ